MTTKAVHPNLLERLDLEIDALAAEIKANHGRKGNPQRRLQLEELEAHADRLLWTKRGLRDQWLPLGGEYTRENWEYRQKMKQLFADYMAFVARWGTVNRNNYGAMEFGWKPGTRMSWVMPNISVVVMKALCHPALATLRTFVEAEQVYRKAVENGLLERSYANYDSKGRGSSINHDIYAYTTNGTLIIVQQRHRTADRRYSNLQISYFVTDGETAYEVQNGVKSLIKRAAKQEPESTDAPLRAILKHLPDDWQARIAPVVEPTAWKFMAGRDSPYWRMGYKIMRRGEDGKLLSLWNDTEWTLGVTKSERVSDDHNSGLYCYENAAEASLLLDAGWVKQLEKKVLVLVRYRGPIIRYGAKIAASHMQPVEILADF